MNPDLFFENFELLADAPNGVQKLRELILQLAVMGKLVEQDPNDEPASMLIEKIKAEKRKSSKEGKNGSKSMSSININRIPYDIPSSWKWATLSECGLINPRNDISNEKEVSFIPMTFISEKYGQNVEMEIKMWEEIKKGFTHFAENDVVLAKITPCFQNGKSAVMRGLKNGVGAGTTELHVFRPLKDLISPDYVLIYLKSPEFIYEGIPKMTGSAGQKRVPKDYFSENPFPLPPISEQKRIVAKVDELMALCNKLETHRQKKQELQSKLNSAALDIMLSAENQLEFEHYWQRICENFDLLYDNPENVEKLKQAILQLAVQGKLVEQNPEDEPASVLIEKIKKETSFGKEKKLDKSEKLPAAIDSDPEIFDAQSNWSWCRFAEIASIQSNLVSPANYPDLPHIAPNNIEKGTGKLLEYTTVAEDEVISPKHYFYPGQLLYSKIRPNLSKVVIASFEGLCSADMYPIKSHINTKYLHLYILSEIFLMQVTDNDNRVAMPKVNQQQLSNVLVPLPPLAEQKRIVEKVEQLMGLCDKLEAKLRKEREESQKLVEAVVKGLLESSATQSELDRCTPIQEVVIPLK